MRTTPFLAYSFPWGAGISGLHHPAPPAPGSDLVRPLEGTIREKEEKEVDVFISFLPFYLPGCWQDSLVLFSAELPDQSQTGWRCPHLFKEHGIRGIK